MFAAAWSQEMASLERKQAYGQQALEAWGRAARPGGGQEIGCQKQWQDQEQKSEGIKFHPISLALF
jgi:hypothetical protein